MENILQTIANTLLINLQTVKKEGLLLGKLGIALFLYKYSRYVDDKDYALFSDLYIEDIFSKMSINKSTDISNGLTGIGWAINYLIDNKFISAEEDENILEELDVYIKNIPIRNIEKDIDADIPIFSKGIYFMARRDKLEIWNTIKEVEECLVELGKTSFFPLSYINSLMYFLLKAIDLNIETECCKKILLNFVKPQIEFSLNANLFINADLLLLKDNIQHFKNVNNNECFFVRNLETSKDDLLDYGLNYLIYGYKKTIDKVWAQNVTLSLLKDVSPDNLSIHQGLAGLGLILLD